MEYKIQKLSDLETAKQVGEFLTGPNAFDQTWAPNESKIVQQAPIDSVGKDNHMYWYIKNDSGEIIATMGIRENKLGSGGYEMDDDYNAVHKDYRGQGLASKLLQVAEQFVIDNGGRYIHIPSCDIDSFAPARAFYTKHRYSIVSKIPNYYVQGEGRVDFFKEV